jgi:hypothetical protein
MPVTYLPAIHNAQPIGGQGKTPNAMELALAARIEAHPEQGRLIMQQHPLLMQVARAKVLDMATRRYEGHTDPDGHGPNWMLRQAGYRLPAWYGQDADDNSVESLLWAGDGDVEEAWQGWMNSTSHRTHLLGENSFYREQTKYGVGYCDIEDSRMRYYYAFISCPPEGTM